jgi:hypothetical protein
MYTLNEASAYDKFRPAQGSGFYGKYTRQKFSFFITSKKAYLLSLDSLRYPMEWFYMVFSWSIFDSKDGNFDSGLAEQWSPGRQIKHVTVIKLPTK